ncbi:ABC transporter substrate-binding protein [Paracoccus laeviglucosivorans]|uniref:Peptide/nickel transport system substrate-binding protein n=1 Tax=Paracoccus laeviglucosivorans TaxID=1197861 RepID=A0A521BH45_9RHOB|nr:ABC transporter substrate-binding protein [Paracoccus laeviglucosivorans]SMO46444.1 peptide/nickel transport system substrate-binding protein [Paracoccus laeviglucosivorans]
MNQSLKLSLKRGFFASVLAMAAGGALAETTVTAVMHSDLRVLDPIITTAHITRDHGYMIYDVLIAEDENAKIKPQMAEFTASDDGLTYTFTLRDGLMFHDGTPVTAEDVVASLKRWGARDSGGQMIMDVTAGIEAKDDKTVVWTLCAPFGPFLETVGKQSAVPPFIMPKRIADTPADTAISEHIGSGPFKFVPAEFQPGVGVTYEKFAEYVPRSEPSSAYAGGKVVNVDKVRWVTMSDSQTAVNALQSGDIDIIESMPVDLIPLLEGDDTVTVEQRASTGFQTMGRMNFKHPPFDNPKIRQAAIMAMSQEPVLAALTGSPEYYKTCGAIFGCGTRLESAAGTETLTAAGNPEGAKALLQEAGYDNTPVVLMQPTDGPTLKAQPVVAAQQLRAAGFNVDMQPMDWQTLVTRRASMDAPQAGGWNIFFTNWQISEIANPIGNVMVNGRGDQAWFGWPDDPTIEDLRKEFIDASTPEAQKAAADKIQAHALEFGTYIPLGEYNFPQARRVVVTDMPPTPIPVFWGIKKAEE